MAGLDKEFTGSIPEIYQRYLVPLIFDPYAQDIAERVRTIGATDVLEIAAGTGVATRAIAKVLPPAARFLVTDLNQAMLDMARASLKDDPRLEWRQADALALPFADESFDAVVCQFGAMFFPDKRRGFKEALRVLKPSGVFLFNVWDSIEENEFADVVTRALADLYPERPPKFLPRTPHGYRDEIIIRDTLLEAGFRMVEVDTLAHVSRCKSSRDPAVAYCQGTPLRNEVLELDPSGLDRATEHAAQALAARFGAKNLEGKIQAIVFKAHRY